MGILDAAGIGKLSEAIGTRFNFDALDLILYKITGRREIYEISAELLPRAQIALDCLESVEKKGTTLTFLYFVVQARRDDNELRDLAVALVPEVASFQAEPKAAVPGIVGGLDRTLGLLENAAVHEAVKRSAAKLANLRRKVNALGVYKFFHDSLHRLQVRRFASLREAAAALGPDVPVSDMLFDFQDQIRASHVIASDQLARLPGDDEERMEQDLWIRKLGEAGQALQNALNARDPQLTWSSLHVAKRILDIQPTAINGRIFAIAETLGLGDLVATLEQVAAVAEEPDQLHLAANAVALKNVNSVLIGRVREHALWQEADDDLAPVDQYFLLPPRDLLTEFALNWVGIKQKLPILWGADPNAAWATQLQLYQRSVEDEMARLDGLLAVSGGGDIRPAAGLIQQFGSFKAEARHRFFVVDTALKTDCEALLAINPALDAILKRLGYD